MEARAVRSANRVSLGFVVSLLLVHCIGLVKGQVTWELLQWTQGPYQSRMHYYNGAGEPRETIRTYWGGGINIGGVGMLMAGEPPFADWFTIRMNTSVQFVDGKFVFPQASVEGQLTATMPGDVTMELVPLRVYVPVFTEHVYAHLYSNNRSLGEAHVLLEDTSTGTVLLDQMITRAGWLGVFDVPAGHAISLYMESASDLTTGHDGQLQSLNVEVLLQYAKDLQRGQIQQYPVLPSEFLLEGGFAFADVPTRTWFDPPLAWGYTYSMTDESLFTEIMEFPIGFDHHFKVEVEGQRFGPFQAGQDLDFVTELGHPVQEFSVIGIFPLVDSEDPTGFPLKLAFDRDTADFEMHPIEAPDQLVGDFDSDFDVDFDDFTILAGAFLSVSGETVYQSQCDIAEPADEQIDMADLLVFLDSWLTP
ncbi:MAG: hypothetical protein JXA82_08830 [Sedimentisphaerales bacterium]|nr:hypothetical protein [Sedimentisphaerales bacterium]